MDAKLSTENVCSDVLLLCILASVGSFIVLYVPFPFLPNSLHPFMHPFLSLWLGLRRFEAVQAALAVKMASVHISAHLHGSEPPTNKRALCVCVCVCTCVCVYVCVCVCVFAPVSVSVS